jgi:tetratricopeptide (TPR) repeat protein
MKSKMKMNVWKGLAGAAILISGFQFSHAQCKEGFPADMDPTLRAQGDEKVAIYTDAVTQKSYAAAVPALQWMLKNAPKWNTRLYVDGVTIYDALASAEKDPKKKQIYVDSLDILHDLRIQYCKDEVNVLNRKALYSAKFNAQNKEKVATVLALFDKVYETSGNNVIDGNLTTYMTVIQLNQTYNKNMTEDQILERYDKVQAVIDAKIAKARSENKAADVDKYMKIKAQVDDILLKIPGLQFNCKFVKEKLEPKYNANPEDIGLAKRIFVFMTKDGSCIDDPLWLKVAEKVHTVSPDFGLALNMAKVYAKNGNVERAEALLDEAVKLASTNEDKIKVQTTAGDLASTRGNKVTAREAYRKVIQLDPNGKDAKEAYEKIGDLYMASGKDCAKLKSKAEDRLVYLAAYEMYQRAGNGQKMGIAKSNFPAKEEIFEVNWKVGDNKSTECWISEVVTIRTRD